MGSHVGVTRAIGAGEDAERQDVELQLASRAKLSAPLFKLPAMVRYHVWVEVTDHYGTRTPRPRRVRYSVQRIAEPRGIVGGRELTMAYKPDKESGIRAGYHDAIKDAAARGEALTADDVEVELELVQEYLKRGKVDRVLRSKPIKTNTYRDRFDELKNRAEAGAAAENK